jgi:molybdate transport system substrate-binding protein
VKYALALLLAPFAFAQNADLHVLCSNGYKAAMEKLLPAAEKAAGRKVHVEYGTSANFKQTIQSGTAFDLTILSTQVLDDLTKSGEIAAGTKMDLASSGIGIAVRAGKPKPDVASTQAVKQMLESAKAVSYVPVGASTPEIMKMLDSMGIKKDVQKKAILAPGAEKNMESVADGQADVAFGLVSEIVPAPGVQLAGPLPAEFQKPVVLSAGIATVSKNREAATKFIKALTTASAAKTIKTVGMDPVTAEK